MRVQGTFHEFWLCHCTICTKFRSMKRLTMTVDALVLLLAISVFSCTVCPAAAADQGTYQFLGYSSDCYETYYFDSGSSFRINAWSSSSKSGSGYGCTIYFETRNSPSNPRFTFKFDSGSSNYISDCGVTLEISDSISMFGSDYSYGCNDYLPEYSNTISSEYFSVKLDRSVFDPTTDFDFSIIVTLEYDDYQYLGVSWYVIVWPIVAFVVVLSIIAGVVRSCRYRQLAHARATNAAVISTMPTNITGTQMYSSPAPPVYPAQPQPYPSGAQPYPSQPQPYPNQPQPYPTQPYSAPAYPGTNQPPPSGDASSPPPKYEDVAPPPLAP